MNKIVADIKKEIIEDINGTPDFLFLAFTTGYKVQEYKKALSIIKRESGAKNIIGGTFPGVTTSNSNPTTQGASIMAIKSNDIHFDDLISYSNVRVRQKQIIGEFNELYKNNKRKSKVGFAISAGPTLEKEAMKQMKVLDTFFAQKFKRIFNALGKVIEKNMGRKGYGTNGYIDTIIYELAKNNFKHLIGGATVDLDLDSYNYQFFNQKLMKDAFVGTIISSDKYRFGQNWTFDMSKRTNTYRINDYLKSGYLQKINEKKASQAYLDLIEMERDFYNDVFENYSYTNLLYLSAFKDKNGDYLPFLTINHPSLDGIISSITKNQFKRNNFDAKLFTQSGKGIKTSAASCASRAKDGLKKLKLGLFINCSNRLLIAGDKIYEENKAIKEVLGTDVPFMTLYTGGEFAIIDGKPINSTVSVHGLIIGK